jgi:hypothetical protein
MGSRDRFAVGHFLGLAVFHQRMPVEHSFPSRHILSSTSAFLQSITRFCLATDTTCAAPPAPLMGFCSLQHMPATGVYLSRGSPAPLRSASRVWLPSWRFAPPETWPGLFHPDSVPGILPFGAFPSRKVVLAFPQSPHPHAVNPTRSPASETRRPVRRASASRLWPLRESLAAPREINPRTAGCSLGISPFQGQPSSALDKLPPAAPLTCFAECSSANCSTAGTLRYRSALDWPRLRPSSASRRRRDEATLIGFLCPPVPVR